MTQIYSFGSITQVFPGKHSQYRVRLDHGGEVIIDHSIIIPIKIKPYKVGCRLAIHLDNGKPIWASTDLSSPKKEIQSNITNPRETAGKKQSKSNTYPDQAKATPEKPTPEKREPAKQSVTIIDYNSKRGHIYVQTDAGKKIKIYLPINNTAWSKIFTGRKFQLEIIYSANGIPNYTLIISVDELNKEPFSYHDGYRKPIAKSPTRSQPDTPVKKGTPRDTSTLPKPLNPVRPSGDVGVHPPSSNETEIPGAAIVPAEKDGIPTESEKIKVDRIGIDPTYFNEREKEGHRFEIMAFLREHRSDDLIEWYRMRHESKARYRAPATELYPPLLRALKTTDSYFTNFYSHQALALDQIRAGKNLIVVTQTASGKTLCYNPAIFEHFLKSDPSAHALYIFPLNALLMDQKEKIDQLIDVLDGHGQSIQAGLLKGRIISRDERLRMAANPPHILALNPELLSVILNESDKWYKFFSNLKYVVIDEVHTYRGILGMHTAGFIRHLLLTTRKYGFDPQFILSSATVNNPMDLATRLTSLPAESFHLLSESEDGSFQANKHWVVLNPDAHDENGGFDNYLNTAAHTMVELITSRNQQGHPSPLNTILFAKSIREVKKAFKIVQENLRANHPDIADKVRSYISADLSTEEKRDIYNDLKTGQLVGVVSTNALEAGIDIGKLDACIIAGFPFWVMRMRQMAGRVGRHQEGLVLFVPHPVRPLDQYYRTNPEVLLTQPPEAFVVDAENPYIARKHINASAYSLRGIKEDDLKIFGSHAVVTAQNAVEDGVMQFQDGNYYGTRRDYTNTNDPYAINGIRSTQQRPYTVCKFMENGNCDYGESCLNPDKKSRCGGQVLVIDQPYAYRDCHPGAIYESMDGNFYQIDIFDDRRRVIRVTELSENTLDRTFAEESTSIEILGQPKSSRTLPGGVSIHLGDVRVTRSFSGYYTYTLKPVRKCRRCKVSYDDTTLICPQCKKRTGKYFNQTKLIHRNFPTPYEQGFEITLTTVACWMTVPAEMENALAGASPCKLPGEDNQVFKVLSATPNIRNKAKTFSLSEEALNQLEDYVKKSSQNIQEVKKVKSPNFTYLFPGVYDQCLLKQLRLHLTESTAMDIYKELTGYPVTDDLRHVCRKCQTSVLLPAMHTIEHTILMRYPSVALGDPTDLESHTTLGHPSTGRPTIFWYDNYAGGLGAADKVFDQFNGLLRNSIRTIEQCSCTELEGCPNCTQIGHCDLNNHALSKPAALILLSALLGKIYDVPLTPYIYSKNKQAAFEGAYKQNEYVNYEHGVGEETPASTREQSIDPYQLLHLQRFVHECVAAKAYEVRSTEITNEVPAVSVVDLTQAYQQVLEAEMQTTWDIKASLSSYQILEILPEASLNLVRHIYRVITKEVHPDKNPKNQSHANEMMKVVNDAFQRIVSDKKKSSYNYEDISE